MVCLFATFLSVVALALPAAAQTDRPARPPYQGPDAEECGVSYDEARWAGVPAATRNLLVANSVWIVNAAELRCLQRRFGETMPLLAAMSDAEGIPGSQSIPWLAEKPTETTVLEANRLIEVMAERGQGRVAVYCHHENCALSLYAIMNFMYGVPATLPLFRMFWFREGMKGWTESGGKSVSIPGLARPSDAEVFQAHVNAWLDRFNDTTKNTPSDIEQAKEIRSHVPSDALEAMYRESSIDEDSWSMMQFAGGGYSGPATLKADRCSVAVYSLAGRKVATILPEQLGSLSEARSESIDDENFKRRTSLTAGNSRISLVSNASPGSAKDVTALFRDAFRNIRQDSLELCS